MASKNQIRLEPNERIAAVVPAYVYGPGWSNRPVWVYIINHQTGKYREECIQPDKQTAKQLALFSAGAAMCASLLGSVSYSRKKETA